MRARIGAREADRAAAVRSEERRVERAAVLAELGHPGLEPRAWQEMELDVRRARARVGVPEAARLGQVRGDRPAAEGVVLEARPQLAVQARVLVVAVGAAQLADHVNVDVILEIPA